MPARLIVLFAVAFLSFSAGCRNRVAKDIASPPLLAVSARKIERRSWLAYPVTYYGRVEPARRTPLSFELAGRLEEVMVDEGVPVRAGQVIARLDTSSLEASKKVLLARRKTESALLSRLQRGERREVVAAARAEVNRLEVEMRQATNEKQRAEKIFAGRAISRSDYEEAMFAHQAAVFSLEQSRKRLEELESGSRDEDIDAQQNRVAMIDAELQVLDVQFERSNLLAPFDGVCVRRHQDEGVSLAAGQLVLEINEADRLEARFSVPRQNLGFAEKTQQIEIAGVCHEVLEVRTVGEVVETTRTVNIVIPFRPDPASRVLPGQTCTLQIHKRIDADCIVVPMSALVASVRGLWSCYRLVPHPMDPATYIVEKSDVSIIHSNGDQVYLSSSLPDQSLIVDRGVHRVVPGMQVRVIEQRQ